MADQPVCREIADGIQKFANAGAGQSEMNGVTPTHEAMVANGFVYADQAGLLFNGNGADERSPELAVPRIVAWGKGDILVARVPESDEQKARGEKSPLKFFIQFNQAPYNGPNDLGTAGGIYKVRTQDIVNDGLNYGVQCSADRYQYHYFPKADPATGQNPAPAIGDVYCLKTRSGTGYALLQVTDVCNQAVVLNFKYNGSSSFFKANREGKIPGQFKDNKLAIDLK